MFTTTMTSEETMAAVRRAGAVYLRAAKRCEAVGAELDADATGPESLWGSHSDAMAEENAAAEVVIDLMMAAELEFLPMGEVALVCPRGCQRARNAYGLEPAEVLFVAKL